MSDGAITKSSIYTTFLIFRKFTWSQFPKKRNEWMHKRYKPKRSSDVHMFGIAFICSTLCWKAVIDAMNANVGYQLMTQKFNDTETIGAHRGSLLPRSVLWHIKVVHHNWLHALINRFTWKWCVRFIVWVINGIDGGELVSLSNPPSAWDYFQKRSAETVEKWKIDTETMEFIT